ncbi:YoaK family protein [Rhodococcus olei]|uniref:YoaK family protein n=1 Tax=Rhodococcus olei TaxID=2161675 RepID=UPI003CD0705F
MNADRRTYSVAVILAALAGYVDAMGYITLGGFFVSFMSGNTTRSGVAVVDGQWHSAAVGAAIVGLFVLGVMLGSLLGDLAGLWRRSGVLAVVAVLLALAAIASGPGPEQVVIAALALAMGAENTVFDRGSGSAISLTYMTGTLVKLGRSLAAALTGGPRWQWVRFAGLWFGLLAGVAGGTAVHRGIGLAGLWVAVVVAMALAVDFARRPWSL